MLRTAVLLATAAAVGGFSAAAPRRCYRQSRHGRLVCMAAGPGADEGVPSLFLDDDLAAAQQQVTKSVGAAGTATSARVVSASRYFAYMKSLRTWVTKRSQDTAAEYATAPQRPARHLVSDPASGRPAQPAADVQVEVGRWVAADATAAAADEATAAAKAQSLAPSTATFVRILLRCPPNVAFLKQRHVRQTFRALSRSYHPDGNGPARSGDAFARLRVAYDTVMDEVGAAERKWKADPYRSSSVRGDSW